MANIKMNLGTYANKEGKEVDLIVDSRKAKVSGYLFCFIMLDMLLNVLILMNVSFRAGAKACNIAHKECMRSLGVLDEE